MNQTYPDPNQLGQIFAIVFVSMLGLGALAGIVMAAITLRRGNANPRCAWSLIIVLAAPLPFCFVAPFAGRQSPPTPFLQAVMTVMGIALLVAMVVGPVLAVSGLIQFYRQPRRWQRGAWAGWVAAVISGGLVACAMLGALINQAVSEGVAARGATNHPGPSSPMRPLPQGAVRLPDGRWRFPEFNFEFRPPAGNWTTQNVQNADERHVVMQKFRPRRVFALVPEKLPLNVAGGSSKWLVQVAENYVRGLDADAVIRQETSVTNGGLPGIQFESEHMIDGMRAFRIQWCFSRHGWAYQLQLRGPVAEAAAIRKEAATLFASFAQLDKNRAAPGWEAFAGEQFRSTNDHFKVNLAAHDWRPFPNLASAYPAAEFAAYEEHDFDLVVLPLALPQPGSTYTPEALTSALLAISPFSARAKNLQGRVPWQGGELQGETATLDLHDLDDPWLGRLRFVWGRQTAWLLVAGGAKKAGPTPGLLDALLDRVELEDVPPTKAADRLPPARRKYQALFLNQLGLPDYRAGRYAQAEDLFRQASELSPENATYLGNQCDALSFLKQYSNGLARLDARLPMVLTNPPLRAVRALFQLRTGDTNAALLQYRETFADGFADEDHLSIFLRLLLETGRTNDAQAQIEAFARTNATTSAQILRARVFRAVDDLPGAIRVLKAERDRSGLSADLGYLLAETYLDQGDAATAHEVSESLLARGYETAESWELRGRAEMQLKRLPEAKKSLETAAKLDPENADIRARLARVSALLGQGDSSGIKTPLPPVNLPAELTRDWPAPLPPARISPHGAQYLDRITAVHFEAGKERRETSKWRAMIYDRGGLERFGTLNFDFDPLHEEIYVNELVVRDGAGKVVATGKADDYYVSDDSAKANQSIASLRKQLNVPVPGLQPGHTLEVTVTRRDLVPPTEFEWLEVPFERETPAARLLVYVEGDVDRVRWEASPGIQSLRGDHFLAWQRDHTPAWVPEPLEPVSFNHHPRLWAADTQVTWAKEIAGYQAAVAEKLGPDEETRAVHAQETAGIPGREERIRALVKAVQTRCTYRALEFGRRARIPNHAGETLRNHYGDCKDQAVLLHELLALSGVSSHLVLANPNQPVHTNLASLDQFTHMIVFIPGDKGGRFVDTTGHMVDPFLLPSVSLGGLDVLLLDPANPRFGQVPLPKPDSAQVNIERELDLTDGTDILIREDVTATGVAAAWLRITLSSNDGATFKTQAQRLLGSLSPPYEVEELTGGGFDSSLEPVRFRFRARLRHQLQHVGDRLSGTLPAVWEPFWFGAGLPAERHAPFEVRNPYQVSVRTRLMLPAGFGWPEARKLTATQEDDFVGVSLKFEEGAGGPVMLTRGYLHPGVFSASRSVERRQALTAALRLMAPAVLLEKSKPAAKR